MQGPPEFDRLVRGRRVVLVGPAGYLEGKDRGAWIDSFDLVVKMNWGETLPAEDYGRTDVLFKRMLKLNHVDDQLLQDYREAELKWLVACETRPNTERTKTIARRLDGLPWHLDNRTRQEVLNGLKSAPLLGTIAVQVLLEHDPALLQLVGMDFYASGYSPDYGGKPYRREMARREGSIGGRHDAAEQLKWLIGRRAQDPRVVFDDVLESLAEAVTPAPGAQPVNMAPRRRKRPGGRQRARTAAQAPRFTWHALNVSSTKPAAAMIRTYLEHRQTREVLEAAGVGELETIAEVGAGFGRMGVLLADLAPHVTLYEREPELVAWARRLLPGVDVVQVPGLAELPADDQEFDLVLTFTVLQHLSEEAARAAAGEVARLARRYALIVEDNDPDYRMRDKKDPTHFTDGRPASWYASALGDAFELVLEEAREVEPGYKGHKGHATAGAYMLFRRI